MLGGLQRLFRSGQAEDDARARKRFDEEIRLSALNHALNDQRMGLFKPGWQAVLQAAERYRVLLAGYARGEIGPGTFALLAEDPPAPAAAAPPSEFEKIARQQAA